MKAYDLAKKLLEYPDFDVEFVFSEPDNSSYGLSVRTFENVEVGDIGHSDKVLVLVGEEAT